MSHEYKAIKESMGLLENDTKFDNFIYNLYKKLSRALYGSVAVYIGYNGNEKLVIYRATSHLDIIYNTTIINKQYCKYIPYYFREIGLIEINEDSLPFDLISKTSLSFYCINHKNIKNFVYK